MKQDDVASSSFGVVLYGICSHWNLSLIGCFGKQGHVNVLGMDFLSANRLSLHIDFNSLRFALSKALDPVLLDDIVD